MMISLSPNREPRRAGFTLVELLVSTALIALLMGLLLSTVDQTGRVWQRTTAKSAQFQASRAAFDAMTRRLSQATLNTFYRAYDANTRNATADFLFRRQSELQFLTGNLSTAGATPGILTATPAIANLATPTDRSYPAQGMFFFAPLGKTDESIPTGATKGMLRFRSADSLLTACGYFVEYGDDPDRPSFLRNANYPARNRFRLVELTVPTEKLTVFQRPLDTGSGMDSQLVPVPWKYSLEPEILDVNKSHYIGRVNASLSTNAGWVRPYWTTEAFARETITGGTGYRFKYGRVLAENVIALIVLPKLAEKDRTEPKRLDGLAPSYQYDSWRILQADVNAAVGAASAARDNLLPPIVQVVMVAIDEPSAQRQVAGQVPDWTIRGRQLFTAVNTESDLLADIAELETRLRADRVAYRIFSTDVVLRGSKWSRDPK